MPPHHGQCGSCDKNKEGGSTGQLFGCVACAGRTVWADIGTTALCFRLAMKLMDYNLMATLTALAAPMLPDFKKAMAARKAQ